MNSRDLLAFEVSVMDMIHAEKPKTIEDYERLSDLFHQHLEIAITDCIEDDENLNVDDYDPNY